MKILFLVILKPVLFSLLEIFPLKKCAGNSLAVIQRKANTNENSHLSVNHGL